MNKDLEEFVKPGSEAEKLARAMDFQALPRHVAIIMDGNGRWARKRRLPRVSGHRAGIASVRDMTDFRYGLFAQGAADLLLAYLDGEDVPRFTA